MIIYRKKINTMRRRISLFDLSDFFNLFNEMDFEKEKTQIDESKWNKLIEESETPTHVIRKEIWKSIDGSSTYQRTIMESKSSKLLESRKESIEDLEKEMKRAIESQEFEKAAEIRDKIKSLK